MYRKLAIAAAVLSLTIAAGSVRETKAQNIITDAVEAAGAVAKGAVHTAGKVAEGAGKVAGAAVKGAGKAAGAVAEGTGKAVECAAEAATRHRCPDSQAAKK